MNTTTGEIYALDIETTGLDRFKDKIIGIGVYNPDGHYFFVEPSDFIAWFDSFVSKPTFITHNGSFDFGFIKHHIGLDLSGYWHADTRAIASILIPRPDKLGLEFLAEKYLGQAPYKLDRTKMSSYSPDEIRDYCLKDCELTYKLWVYLKEYTDQRFVETWIMPAVKFCSDMEYGGVYVNKEGLEAYQKEQVAKRDQILVELKERAKQAIIAYHEIQVTEIRKVYKEMYEKAKEKIKESKPFERFAKETSLLRRYAKLESSAILRLEPFNWNSPKQLTWLLKDYYSLDVEDRDGKDSTSEAVLRSLDHPVSKILCDYRETEKLVSTCIPALLENIKDDGFVHTHYHIGGTRTGRLSSSGPNLQQIPRGPIRSYVRHAHGSSTVLGTIDYGQIEVRIIAELSKEKELINAFKQDIDPYSVIASKLLNIPGPIERIKKDYKKERDVSKTAGLSILYGTGARKLQEVLKKELNRSHTVEECKRFIEDYRNSFPQLKEFKLSLERRLSNAKVYKNLLGRPFIIESNEDVYMKALNTLVQGSASDLVLHSAIKVQQKLRQLAVPAKCRLLIHDEQVWELPEDEADLLLSEVIVPAMTTEIERELGLTVPLKVEYTISREWEKP